MEHDDPSAQGDSQYLPTENGQQPEAQHTDVPPGIQARFDQLTARYREQERRAEEAQRHAMMLQQQHQELILRLTQREQQPEELPDIDPEVATVMERRFAQLQQQMGQQVQQVRQQMASQQLLAEAQAVGAAPEVTQRAQQLMAAWAAKGLDVATPTDALNFALGEYARTKGRTAHAAPAAPFAPAMGQPAAPSAPRGRAPQNLDAMSPEQQLAYFDSLGDVDI